jgi:hypothetical protein
MFPVLMAIFAHNLLEEEVQQQMLDLLKMVQTIMQIKFSLFQ